MTNNNKSRDTKCNEELKVVPGEALLIHIKDRYMVILLENVQETQHTTITYMEQKLQISTWNFKYHWLEKLKAKTIWYLHSLHCIQRRFV